MKLAIEGTVAQSAQLTFDPGESAWASKGSIIGYTSGLKWDIRVPGGIGGAVRRSLSGEGISLTHIESTGEGQTITLGANSAGHIVEWDLETLGPVLTTRGAFLAAWGKEVNITVSVARRAGAAFFGGAGLFLQRIEGQGKVLIHGRGDFRELRLDEGEVYRVSTGNLAAFSDGLDYDIESVGSIRKSLFSKEGFFLTRLTGPGSIFLQTMKSLKLGHPSGQ